MLKHLIFIFTVLNVACSQEPSEVFVPGPSFKQSITLLTAQGERATIRAEQSLVLHAQRSSGPWVLTKRDQLAADACWLVSPPPDLEAEVADNLKWIVEPAGTATFNIGLRTDHTREVRFSQPGLYQLTARSSAWCTEPYGGNTLTVEVRGE